MDRQERMEKKNKTLGTEIFENIDTLYLFYNIDVLAKPYPECQSSYIIIRVIMIFQMRL